MQLTLSHYDTNHQITANDGLSTAEVVDLCMMLVLASGHAPENVAAAAAAWGEERLKAWFPVDSDPDTV